MLKLKIVASILGATSLVLLIMGSTHLTIAMAVICATVAGISATDIVLRLPSYITGGEKVFSKVILAATIAPRSPKCNDSDDED